MLSLQFHPSYGYEDFVEGIRPSTSREGGITYKLQDGSFKAFCEQARQQPTKPFVVVVDEINRGNISRIFGELLLLLEYRDRSVSLAYSGSLGTKFSIPPNVLMIGTMNSTDRSLAQIDYALRRRFYFFHLAPVIDGKAPVLERWLTQQGIVGLDQTRLLDAFLRLNARIREELGEDFQVGHSYLMQPGIANEPVVRRVWQRGITPLLEEYFHNRRDKGVLVGSLGWAKLNTVVEPAIG